MEISEITYKNNLSDFLDYNAFYKSFLNFDILAKKVDDDVVDKLNEHISKKGGGLDPDSFYIEGKSLLNENANECKEHYERLLKNYVNLKEKILSEAINHRYEELTKYIECLNDRIFDVERQISGIDSRLSNIYDASNNASFIEITEVQNQLRMQKKLLLDELKGGSLINGLYFKKQCAENELSKLG